MEDSIFKPLEEYYDRLKEQDKEVENAMKAFVKNHKIEDYKIYVKGGQRFLDVIGNVALDSSDVKDGKLPFPFGKVSGSFSCNSCFLTSLENSPVEVGDGFYCSGNRLESLAGAPKKVGIKFECAANAKDFSLEDIAKVSKVGHKVKEMPLPTPVSMCNGEDSDYPTKVVVDKYRITTRDNVGVVVSLHVVCDYFDNSQNKSMMRVTFWSKYCMTHFDKTKMQIDRVDGLQDYLPKDVCEGISSYFIRNMNALCGILKLSKIDFNNYDIPASSSAYYEGGYPELSMAIGDKGLPLEHMRSFTGDCWMNGIPIFELEIFDAFYTSTAK